MKLNEFLTSGFRIIFFLAFFYISICYSQAHEGSNQKFEVSSTSIIKKTVDGDKQLVFIKNNAEYLNCSINMKFPDSSTFGFDIKGNAPIYEEIPVLKTDTKVFVEFSVQGSLIYKNEFVFHPPKQWTIYDIQVSHHDLGYADYYHMMRRDVREMGIEMALDFCRQTNDNPNESKFRWTIETSEPLLPFLQNKPDSIIQELIERIKQGRIALGGVHNSASTEHLSYETYARLFYTPNRHVADWLQIPPSRTALITDVVGFTRSLPLYSKEADINYFFLGRNSTVNEFENLQEEPAFYWNSQDKDSQKTLFKMFEYYSPDRFTQYNIEEIGNFLNKYEVKENWPYNCLMSEDSYDFSVPSLTNIEGIKKWNEDFSNPVIFSGTFDMFFDDLSNQEKLRPFEEFEKDVPNSWSDQDYGDAQYAGKVHRLGYKLPEVEKFASIAQSFGKGRYPWEEIYQGYNRLLMYAEHTNGAYAEGPIYVPESLKDATAANATYYEVEQEMHRVLVDEAEMFTDKAASNTFNKLANLISSTSDNSLIVYNSLNYNRDDVVTFTRPKNLREFKLIDNSTKEFVSYQILPNESVMFLAENVPSVGYKTYSLVQEDNDFNSLTKLSQKKQIENEYYIVEFDKNSGAIKSIYDKDLQKELVDQDAVYGFNDYIYQRYETRSSDKGMTEYRSDSASIRCFSGELTSIMESEIFAFGCDSIKQTVKLHKGIKRIDFELNIIKSHSGRSLELYREGMPMAKNKEALYYAFPFNVPNFAIRHELPGGSVEPIADQSAGSSTDYYAIQHYTDLSNNEYGVTLALTEPNLIEYGSPRAAPWNKGDGFESILKKPEKPSAFLYLANNTFFTNMRQSQHGKMNFRWSLTSHSGNWREGKAYKSGWTNTHPLKCYLAEGKRKGVLPESGHSFLSTNSDNVICSTIKPAESNGEGYILRFFETSGKQTTVKTKLAFGFQIASVIETNLIEENKQHELALGEDNSFEFDINPFGIKTIRVIPASAVLPKTEITEVKSLADRNVNLEWKSDNSGIENIAYYKIYRSEKLDFNPSIRTYVGSTDKQKYIDEPVLNFGGWISTDLKPSTTYYYKIVPIGKNNSIGQVSNRVKVVTKDTKENNLPPGKVHGVYTTHVSDIAPFNYNAVFFYTNIETDVIKYQIYRSTQKGFTCSENTFLAEVDVTQSFEHVTPHGFARVTRKLGEFNRQLFVDQNVEDRKKYFYKICAVDDAGNIGEFSDEVEARPEVYIIDIKGNRSFSDKTTVTISPELNKNLEIRYTLDESEPTVESKKYSSPFGLIQTISIKAAIFKSGKKLSLPTIEKTFYKSNDYKVIYNIPYNKKWPSTGDLALVDNAKGNYYTDGFWQGFEFENLDIIIDLKKTRKVSQINSTFLNIIGAWIFLPQYVEFFVSGDGETYVPVGKINTEKALVHKEELIEEYSVKFPPQEIRYIRVFARNQQVCPPWHPSAGGKAWLFVDEIIVE